MKRPFLTATWSNLCLFSYAVDDAPLKPFLPPGLQLDRWKGNAVVSLVAFDFLNAKVKGIPWPGFRNFPEINLRFYVTDGERRGVVFIREYVPQRFVAWMAKTIYNEPYVAAPMSSEVSVTDLEYRVQHTLTTSDTVQCLQLTASGQPTTPAEDSEAHHFKEHQWGFGTSRKGQLVVYEVRHPHWAIIPVSEYSLEWSWEEAYGPKWAFLNDRTPDSVVFAVGSAVEVYPKQNR